MSRPRTSSVLAATLVLAVGTLAGVAACGRHEARTPVTAPGDVHLAGAVTPASPAPSPPGPRSGTGGRLDAARVIALYCDLLDDGQFARAGELCALRRLWSRRAFAALRGLRFRSARVYATPDARTIVFKARVFAHAGRGCPVPDGLATLFFTLGRVTSAVGGWRITAVSAGP